MIQEQHTTSTSQSPELSITVGIPTYNRPEALIRRLTELETFLDSISHVVVCDNSDVFNDAAQEICDRHPNWSYTKNLVNLGSGANFLRTLELAKETTHFWWRGDDDIISKSQVDAVRNGISKDEILILDPDGRPPFSGRGLEIFCRNFSLIQAMGWISMLVIPAEIAQRSLWAGYAGIPTGYPFFSLVLAMLEADDQLKFKVKPFDFKLSDFRDVGEKEGQRWAFFGLAVKGFSGTANVIKDRRIRALYLEKWRNTQSFKLIKKMVSVRLGLITNEPIDFSTLSPLLSLRNPNKIPLFVILCFLAKCPPFLPRAAIAAGSLALSSEKLKFLNLGVLSPHRGFVKRYQVLKAIPKGKLVTTY